MARAARGAGLIFVCNPNNPTSTVHTASDIEAFVNTVRRTSPDTVRISISTTEDMQRATKVFGEVLGVSAEAEAA